jgi:hypothetical protein
LKILLNSCVSYLTLISPYIINKERTLRQTTRKWIYMGEQQNGMAKTAPLIIGIDAASVLPNVQY